MVGAVGVGGQLLLRSGKRRVCGDRRLVLEGLAGEERGRIEGRRVEVDRSEKVLRRGGRRCWRWRWRRRLAARGDREEEERATHQNAGATPSWAWTRSTR